MAPTTLAVCPSSPNCVSSLESSPDHHTEPFDLAGISVAAFLDVLAEAIASDGGVVKDSREGYLWATYTSAVFRFVDDIEFLYNPQQNHFDVRSESRTGYSDFGVNTKRVERLRQALN